MANSRKLKADKLEPRPRAHRAEAPERVYEPDGDVVIDFLMDRSLVSILMGPLGSAKTIALMHKILALASEAEPSPDGLRRSRAFLIRNTYSDLVTTTMAKWKEWFPEEEYGRVKMEKPPRVTVRQGDVELEVWFLALDQEDDIRKLRSLEPSIIAFNEGQFVSKDIFDEATSRVGRYPADVPHEKRTGVVIADMNAPDETHWTAYLFGLVPPPEWMSEADKKNLVKPEGWALFTQPPAVVERFGSNGEHAGFEVNEGQVAGVPAAENLRYLGVDYYKRMLAGKSVDWVRNRLMVKVGSVADGEAVWPMFQPAVHVAREPLRFNSASPLVVGLDFGRKPAAVIGQAVGGRIYVLGECWAEGMSSEVFAPMLKRHLAVNFPDAKAVQLWGDPAGGFPGQAEEKTSFDIFRAHGLPVRPAPHNNDLEIRLEAVTRVLNEMHNGAPRFVMDPHRCTMLKAALNGGYRFRQIRGTDRESATPDKGRYSHIADALQYLMLGMGEGRALIMGGRETPKAIQTALYRRGSVVDARRRFARR